MISVSVIIPTHNRPALLERAIRSVLAQTFQDFEVIVVIDGPGDSADPAFLESLDPRIRTLSLQANVGLAEARNCGIRAASGTWIALLDDDDEWLSLKLDRQVAKALELNGEFVFVPCRFIERTLTLQRDMPTALPTGAARFSEYIYCEGGYLQPSMYFMSRALALAVPFTPGLRHVEDSDWLLRMSLHPQVIVGAVEETLSIYYNLKDGTRESETTPWKHPLAWALTNHTLFTRKAFPYFIARLCINAKRSCEPMSVFFALLSHASRYGRMTPKILSYFFAYWFLSDDLLKSLRLRRRKIISIFKRRPDPLVLVGKGAPCR